MSPILLARALGAGRAALGAALLAVPDRVTAGWIGSDAATPGGRTLARGLGARDVVLGVGALVAPAPSLARAWILAGIGADAADAISAAATPALPRNGRLGTLALAGASAAAGAWLVRALN